VGREQAEDESLEAIETVEKIAGSSSSHAAERMSDRHSITGKIANNPTIFSITNLSRFRASLAFAESQST